MPIEDPGQPAARDGESGLTLVELLLSLVLLSFVVLGSISLLTTSMHQNNLAKHRSIATSLAAERLDHLTSVSYKNAADFADYRLPEETTAAGPPAKLVADYGVIPEFPEYRRVVTLEYDVPQAGLMKASVEIFWRDVRQGEKRHALLTLLHPALERR